VNVFQYLLDAPNEAIFAVINDFNKTIYVSYTHDLQRRLGIITSEILSGYWFEYNELETNTKNIDFRILETNVDRVLVKYYIDDYRNKGYSVYGKKIPLQYKFRIEFGVVSKGVEVIAVNKRNDKICLGKFQNFEEASNFLSYVNRNNKSMNLIYSIDGCGDR
jgi:hypothetical protein